jgi:RND family efflux transporter MFP subunit
LTRLAKLPAWALVAAILLAGCAKHNASDEQSSNEQTVAEVTVAKVLRAPIAQELLVSGNLASLPNRDAKVAALVPGRISRVLVIEGNQVNAGQLLAELENGPLRDQERQAEAAVAQARANFENAKNSAQRNERLLQRGIAAQKEVEDARTQLAVSEATLKQAEAALSTAKTQVSRSEISAPFEGTVVHRFLGAGEQVDGTAAQPIVEVAALHPLELMGVVPAFRINEIRVGEAFSFQSKALPGVDLSAAVVGVLPAIDPATNNGTVRIRIQNPKHQLKLGEYLSIELPLKQSGARLVVPRQAVYPDESGAPHVYKVQGDEAVSMPVQVGIQTSDKAEIISGVQEGDTVIVDGGYGLPEKSKVRVKQ